MSGAITGPFGGGGPGGWKNSHFRIGGGGGAGHVRRQLKMTPASCSTPKNASFAPLAKSERLWGYTVVKRPSEGK